MTRSDISSYIHLRWIQFAKESIEYKVVSGYSMTTERKLNLCALTDKKRQRKRQRNGSYKKDRFRIDNT